MGDNSEVELLHDYMISSDRFAAEEILGYDVDNEGEEDDTVNEAGDNDEDLDDDGKLMPNFSIRNLISPGRGL